MKGASRMGRGSPLRETRDRIKDIIYGQSVVRKHFVCKLFLLHSVFIHVLLGTNFFEITVVVHFYLDT